VLQNGGYARSIFRKETKLGLNKLKASRLDAIGGLSRRSG
jgi:hypothetical protein